MSKKKKTYDKSNTFNINQIRTRGKTQHEYLETLENYDVVFAIGPAGVGKTLLAVAYGIHLLHTGVVERIVITRPVREVGENLGFLPGNLHEKMDPYMKPIFDFMMKFMSKAAIQLMFDQGLIEIAPLAYMRGRTFDNAFVLLDEGQNTTKEQMKMFLTRIGMGSRAVITGDPGQSDLAYSNGLDDAVAKLEQVEDVAVVRFDNNDIVRNPIISKIINAYEGVYDSSSAGPVQPDTEHYTDPF